MARRPDEDDEDQAPVERQRRRPRKKPVAEDEDDGGGPPGRRPPADDAEDEEINSLSTGNVFLDIILDFRDDCFYWAKDHLGAAIGLGIVILLLVGGLTGLTIRYIINYINRPTIETVLTAYHYGSYGEARILADKVLEYTPPEDLPTRATALFVLGASTCSIAEIAWNTDRQPYYLAAANYLSDAEKLGFPADRRAEGYFLLGKSLYMSGRLNDCREPLLNALEYGTENTKMVHWYLSNAYFLDARPNLSEALRSVRLFRNNRLTTEDERFEGDMLEAMIQLQRGDIEAAERSLLRVPMFERFETMRSFINGQIAFLKARRLRQEAIDLEADRSPVSTEPAVVAPVSVEPQDVPPLEFGPDEAEMPNHDLIGPPEPPFEDPETEKLLPNRPSGSAPPAPPELPKGPNDASSSDGPIFPVLPGDVPKMSDLGPWPVVSPAPVPEVEEDGTKPLFRRMSWLVAQKAGLVEAPAENNAEENSEPKTETETKPVDLDAVLVLPTPERGKDSAPMPGPLPSVVEDLTPTDPRLRRARSLRDQAAEKYKEAIEHFRQVRRRDTFVPRWIRTAELLEGLSYDEMDDPVRAQETYLNLGETYPLTSEAAAAYFLWAEIQRELGRPEIALTGYAKAFEIIRNEPGFVSPWLPREAILVRCETILRDNLLLKEYKQALTLLSLLKEVMPESDRLRYRTEVYEQWAQDLDRRAMNTLGPEGEELAREAREKYRRTGDAVEEYARLRYGESDYDTQIWRCAENYRLGRDYRRAIQAYRKYMQANWRDRQPETLYYMGEIYLHLDDLERSIEQFERALRDYPNHSLVPRIRLALSRGYFEKREWDKARSQLQLNLVGEYAPSSAIYRDSMYALGKLFYEQGDLDAAIPFLEDAVKIHPDAIQAADTHYYLSQAYRKRSEAMVRSENNAALENVRREISLSAHRDMENALFHIRRAEKLLLDRRQAVGLSESERLMLRNTLFGSGDLLMRLGLLEQAISTFDIAASRYQDRPESLDALMQIVVAYRDLGRPLEALPILNRAEVLLYQLEKSGTIPPENNWASQIQVQRNLITRDQTPPSNVQRSEPPRP